MKRRKDDDLQHDVRAERRTQSAANGVDLSKGEKTKLSFFVCYLCFLARGQN